MQAGGGIDLVQLVRGHPEAPSHALPPLPHHPSHLNPAMSVPAQVRVILLYQYIFGGFYSYSIFLEGYVVVEHTQSPPIHKCVFKPHLYLNAYLTPSLYTNVFNALP
jgi:hypothetical protein